MPAAEKARFFLSSYSILYSPKARGGRLQEIFCRGDIDRLLQIFSEEGREFIEWDEFHPVIKVNLTGAWKADEYAIADGKDLPFKDGQFDLVMAYNVLMDVEDVPATLKEIRRLMKPDGVLLISLVQPFRDRGAFAGSEPGGLFCPKWQLLRTRAI
jgi:SAM-dependent methyltransferase